MTHYINTTPKRVLSCSSSSSPMGSLNNSFSTASWETCSMVNTPISNHDIAFDTSCMSDTSAFTNPFSILNSNNQDIISMSLEPHRSHSISFDSGVAHSNALMSFSCAQPYSPVESVFGNAHGLPTPPIDMSSYSPISYSQNSGFVTPSETTFGQFDAQSPMRPQNSLNLQIHYNSPAAEYQSECSFDGINNQCFDDSFRSSMTPASSIASTPSRMSVSRPIKTEALQASAALQNIQNSQSNPIRKKIKSERRLKRSGSNARSKSMSGDIDDDFITKRYPQGGYDCSFPGCNKKFQRTEHCKRHENTVHKNERFPCLFCKPGKEKTFQPKRMDNYRTHLDLHLKNTPRTFYNPDAAAEILRLDALKKGNKGSKGSKCVSDFDDLDDLNETPQRLRCRL